MMFIIAAPRLRDVDVDALWAMHDGNRKSKKTIINQEKKADMNRLLTSILCFAAVSLAMPVQAAGDPQAGAQKNSMCQGCHGIPGWRTAFPDVYSVPKLGGQHADYIVAALKAYKSGERSHPSMTGIVDSLSEQDMQDLAAYYAAASAPVAAK
jgi:cytochrome c553